MGVNSGMFSSGKDEWETPPGVFEPWNNLFQFTLDVCATPENTKCERFFTKEDDGLRQDWSQDVCWMNPPYGREIGKWVKKAYEESQKGAIVVCLLPVRTDTAWFHDWVKEKAKRIVFLHRRIKFVGAKSSAPFPSMVAIYAP